MLLYVNCFQYFLDVTWGKSPLSILGSTEVSLKALPKDYFCTLSLDSCSGVVNGLTQQSLKA